MQCHQVNRQENLLVTHLRNPQEVLLLNRLHSLRVCLHCFQAVSQQDYRRVNRLDNPPQHHPLCPQVSLQHSRLACPHLHPRLSLRHSRVENQVASPAEFRLCSRRCSRQVGHQCSRRDSRQEFRLGFPVVIPAANLLHRLAAVQVLCHRASLRVLPVASRVRVHLVSRVDSLPGSHLVFPVGPLLACRRRGLLLSRRAFLVQGRAASQVYVRVGNRALSRVAHLALSRAESRVGRRRVARVASQVTSQVPNLVASRVANLALSPVENHLEFRLVVRVVNPHLSRHASLLLCQAANRACVRQVSRQVSLPVNRVAIQLVNHLHTQL